MFVLYIILTAFVYLIQLIPTCCQIFTFSPFPMHVKAMTESRPVGVPYEQKIFTRAADTAKRAAYHFRATPSCVREDLRTICPLWGQSIWQSTDGHACRSCAAHYQGRKAAQCHRHPRLGICPDLAAGILGGLISSGWRRQLRSSGT